MFSNFGTKFQIGSGSGTLTWTDVFGVFLIPAIESEQEKIEVTHHDQSSRYREFIPTGLISPGDNFPVQMRSKPSEATQQSMFALYKSGDLGHFRIVRCKQNSLTIRLGAAISLSENRYRIIHSLLLSGMSRRVRVI